MKTVLRLWCGVVGLALFGVGLCQAAAIQKAEPPRLVGETGHGAVKSVALSPDGKTLASGSSDGVNLWDAATGKELRTLAGHMASVHSVAFSPDGKMVVSGSEDGTVKLWDVATGKALRTLGAHSAVWSVAFSPDGKLVVSGSEDKTVKLWDVARGTALRTLTGHSEPVWSVAFSPDGKMLASGSWDKTVKLWDVATGKALRTLAGHSGGVNSVAFSPDGKTLVSGGWDNIKLWDVATGKALRTLTGHSEPVWSVAFSPDGKMVVSGSEDKTVKLWDVATGTALRTLTGHSGSVNSVAFSPDGKMLASGSSWDGTIKLWDVATGTALRTLTGHSEPVWSVAFSPDGKTVVSGSVDKTIKLWDVATGKALRTLTGHTWTVTSVAFSPDGKMLASGSWDKTVKVWDVATGTALHTLAGHSAEVTSVAFSPDGKTLASGSQDRTVKLWDVATGTALRTLTGHTWTVKSVAFSPDGKTVVSGCLDNTIKLWDVATGTALRTLTGHTWTVESVAFSPDGKTVVSGSGDGTIKLWDVATGRELRSLAGRSRWVSSVAFSPDGKTVVSGGLDKTVKLWDVATGTALHTLAGHSDEVTSVAFPPDGKMVVSGSDDTTTKLWRVADGALLATLFSFDDGGWAVSDPEGRFDASNGGDSPYLHWVFENTPIALNQLKDRYYDPGLLQKVMGFSKEPLRTVPQFEDAILHRWPEVSVAADERNPLRVVISLRDRGDGYGRVRVRLNGKELTADAANGRRLSGKSVSLGVDLDPERLLPGDNHIDVVAWPKTGFIPSPAAQIIISGETARGMIRDISKISVNNVVTLHAIVIGVSRFANSSLRLAFSGKDAADFARALELGGDRMFGADRVRLHLLTDYSEEGENVAADHLPSRDNLRRAFETVSREAKAGDILVVYLAGHGVMTPGVAGEAEYYYLTRDAQGTDLTDPAVRKLWGVSSTELTEWIKAIKANKEVLILDTCAAGGAIEKLIAKREIPGAQTIALEQLKERAGIHILAGSAADQVSYEATRYGQGLLTYALLTGVKGAALNGEIVDVEKLFQYTRDDVPRLARQIGGIQEPHLSSPQGESFAIGRMAEEDRRKVPLAQVRPMIERANFQDEERMRDVLKLGERFEDRLKMETYVAARGALVYVDADDFPDAWQVTGRYRSEKNGVRVMARLFQGDTEKAAFEVLLPVDEAAQPEALLAATLKAMGKASNADPAR